MMRPVVLQQQKKKGKSKANSSNLAPGTGQTVIENFNAPIAQGLCVSNVMMMKLASTPPQRSDEYVPGCRLVGSTMFHYDTVSASLGSVPPFTVLAVGAGGGPWGAAGGATIDFVRRVTPAALGARVISICSGFRYYAIRKLVLRFIPVNPTSTAGQMVMGLVRDPSAFVRNSTSAQADNIGSAEGILTLVPSVMSPIWAPCSLIYEYRGPKVWSMISASTAAADVSGELASHVQLCIAATTPAFATVTAAIGRLMIDYVLDVYEPGPLLNVNGVQMLPPMSQGGHDEKEEPVLVVRETVVADANISSRSRSTPPTLTRSPTPR